jgi:hypothetical protein
VKAVDVNAGLIEYNCTVSSSFSGSAAAPPGVTPVAVVAEVGAGVIVCLLPADRLTVFDALGSTRLDRVHGRNLQNSEDTRLKIERFLRGRSALELTVPLGVTEMKSEMKSGGLLCPAHRIHIAVSQTW